MSILGRSQGYHSLYTDRTTVSNRLRGKRALHGASQAPIRFWNDEGTPMVYPCHSQPSKVVPSLPLNHLRSPASPFQTSIAEISQPFVHPSSHLQTLDFSGLCVADHLNKFIMSDADLLSWRNKYKA